MEISVLKRTLCYERILTVADSKGLIEFNNRLLVLKFKIMNKYRGLLHWNSNSTITHTLFKKYPLY